MAEKEPRPLWMPEPLLTSHVVDPSVPEWHTGPQSMPHQHYIREEASVEQKNRIAVHISQWHWPHDAPRDEEPPTGPQRRYSSDRG